MQADLDAQIEGHEDELREVSATSKHGDYNLIAAGLQEFKEILQIKNKKDSMRPGSDLEFVLWRAIESRAGGRLDLKQQGRDQTNRAGMKSVENCHKVFDALAGMYSSDHEIHQWLSVEVPKWQRLGDALFDIGCFLKSQRKRSPDILDMKLLRLYCRWDDAFPGKKFNKFHGMFCTIRRYVHEFKMTGRVSEEGGGVQRNTKGHKKGTDENAVQFQENRKDYGEGTE